MPPRYLRQLVTGTLVPSVVVGIGDSGTDATPAQDDGYDGDVTVTVGAGELTVPASMRGYFEPIDGRYHWYGRLAADTALTELVGNTNSPVRVSTAHGSADGAVGDIDPWGRLRIAGVGTPPFPVARELADVERDKASESPTA